MKKLSDRERQSRNSKFRNELIKNATKSELIFKSKLDKLKIKYHFQKGFIKGSCSCIVDFYLPRPKRLVIEIDGGYHNTPEQKAKDAWRTKYLTEEREFKVMRLTNEEAETITLNTLKLILKGTN